jgi:hypothetical protein
LGVLRRFNVRENQYFELRGEFFNAINDPSFAMTYGNEYINSGTFGQLTATSTNPRTIQLALKYIF